MSNDSFNLKFIREETHMVMSTIATIVITQTLYDILFQYAISEEKEHKLEIMIKKLEAHIKSKVRAPFSMSIEELSFLDDGLEELRLLNWAEVPILIFAVETAGDPLDEEGWEKLTEKLNRVITFSHYKKEEQLIKVFPLVITAY